MKLSKVLNNGCDDFLFGVHCVEEGDRIPPLQSYGQALKEENCFSGVLRDDCGASASLLEYVNGHVIPCACCFYGNGVEHRPMCACQLGVLGNLVLCRLMNCRPWSGHRVSDV